MQFIKTSQLTWYNIENPKADDIEYLRKNFNFHPLDLEDCLSSAQRPKLDEYPNYLFLILIFPVYNRNSHRIEPSEIDMFIARDYLITLHDKKLDPISKLFNECSISEITKTKYLLKGNGFLLYQILEKLFLYCFPILDHITKNIENIQKKIFLGKQREMVEEILINKQNIVNIRIYMKTQKNVLKKLKEKEEQFFALENLKIYFQNLIDYTENIWDILESQKDSIEAIEETNNALLSHRLNQIMKTLTVISVIMLPLGLIANLFGMNVKYPFLETFPYSFWLIFLLMIFLTGILFSVFKKKKWL